MVQTDTKLHHLIPKNQLSDISETSIRITAVIRYIIILLGILFLFLRHPEHFFNITVLGPYIIFISAAVLNTGYMLVIVTKKLQHHFHGFVVLQITFDALIISGLVFFTGGVLSAITSFYFAVILTASILLSLRESMFFASLSIILFSIVHILYAMGISAGLLKQQEWQYPIEMGPKTWILLSKLLFHAAAFYTVAFLTGTLANMLKSARILNIEILENINEGLLVVDRHQRVSFYNPAFCRLFSIPETGISKGMDAFELFDGEQAEITHDILLGDISKSGEYMLSDTPSPVHVNIKATRLTGRKNDLRGVIILFENISADKEMEKALVRIDRYRAIVEMSAGLAHEIRNPLASIRGCAEELTNDPDMLPENTKMFEIIRKESDRLSNIIDDFSDYLKESPPRKIISNIQTVIEETVSLAEQNPVFAKISFSLDIEDLNIPLDPGQWKQVFLNLFLNASEAMAQKIFVSAKKITAENVTFARQFVSVEEIDYGVEITVSDTGGGIEQDNLSNVFIPFYTTKDKGIGVGLSIVNRIIRSHGGIIEVKSTGTSGTTFIIILPVYKKQGKTV